MQQLFPFVEFLSKRGTHEHTWILEVSLIDAAEIKEQHNTQFTGVHKIKNQEC